MPDRWPLPVSYPPGAPRSEEHTSELQSPCNLVCRLLLVKKIHFCDKGGVGCCRRSAEPAQVYQARAYMTGVWIPVRLLVFFFNDTATTEIYALSLPGALPV